MCGFGAALDPVFDVVVKGKLKRECINTMSADRRSNVGPFGSAGRRRHAVNAALQSWLLSEP